MGILSKRRTLGAIAVICSVITVLSAFAVGSVFANRSEQPVVVLDAGHGGIDGGVVGISTKVKESDVNLAITLKLKEFCEAAGIAVILTRKDEGGLYGLPTKGFKNRDMQARKRTIERAKPLAVVSVHQNAFSMPSRRGAQVFYRRGSGLGYALALRVQGELNELQQTIRVHEVLIGDYYLLNCSDYTSVLVECGFLSNPDDEALLITDEYQSKVAYAIFKGLIGYLADETFFGKLIENGA